MGFLGYIVDVGCKERIDIDFVHCVRHERAGVDLNSFFGKTGHAIFDGEINDLKSLDEALELGVVKQRGKRLIAL